MRLYFTGNTTEITRGTEILGKRLGYELNKGGIRVEVEKTDGSIEVRKEGEKVVIKYQDKIHFFRALGLLLEKLPDGGDFTITEVPKFKTNGIMVDVSRNAVMTVQSVKVVLEIMAVMGLNMMMLYTEDTYEIKSFPYFGYMRGRYTYEELRECDQYAEFFGIEMIPCIQTLAHLLHALKWSYANEIKDTADILLVGNEKTYEFIEEMIKTASAPFRSKRIHIGMDEAHNLGLGRYLAENGYRRRFDIMNEHLVRVRGITAKYGLKPMIWSDMYFRLGSKTGAYYDIEADIPEDIIADIPKDIQLVYWDYYHHDKGFYRQMIDKHRFLGCDTIFAGGIWTWNGITINNDKTFINTDAALKACKEEKINEVFATLWANDVAETNMFTALLGMQLFAEHGYMDEVGMEKLRKRFSICTGGDYESFYSLSKLDTIPTEKVGTGSNPSEFLLWQDILTGLFDRHVEGKNLPDYYAAKADELRRYAEKAGKWKFLFDMPVKLATVLSLKSEIGVNLKYCYDKRDFAGLKHFVNSLLPELSEKVSELRAEHRKQWLKVNKAFGWDITDLHYGGLIARIDTAKYRLMQFLSGEIEKIDELEEEKLFFDGPERPVQGNIGYCINYYRIATASHMGNRE